MAPGKDSIFTAANRDKIRVAVSKGKRTITFKDRKFKLKKQASGHILVMSSDGSKTPMAVVESAELVASKQKARDKSIQQHHKDVKSGAKVKPNFAIRKKAKAK